MKLVGSKPYSLSISKSNFPLQDLILDVSNIEYEYEDRYSEMPPSEKSSELASIKDSVEWDKLWIDLVGEGIQVSAVKGISVETTGGIPTVTIISDESPFTGSSKDCKEKCGRVSV